MKESSKNLLARFLFRDKGILPTKRLILLLAALNVLLQLGNIWNLSWKAAVFVNAAVFLASFFDLLFSPKKGDLSFSRELPDEMERGLPYKAGVIVEKSSPQPFSFSFIDGLPDSFVRPFPFKGKASGPKSFAAEYETIATERGDYTADRLYFRYSSPLGLWEKQRTVSIPHEIKVIPDLTESKRYLENAQRYLLYEGDKIRKHASGSGEFSQIRQYVVGDDPRMINWRQTAKLQEVMANEYEPEHGKYITILIDCGRMMGAELTEGNRLEKSLEAAMTVAAAALQKGDYVSLLAFSSDVKVFVPPAKGMAHLQTILHAIYGLKVDAAESNYAQVLSYLEAMQKKRSLLLLFSDIRTFLHEESALLYLQRLRRRHLFFMIGVEDETLKARVEEEPSDVKAAMVKSMAQQEMLFKKREKAKWEKQGLSMIEAPEEKLAVAAVSHYIDTMNRNLL